MKISGRPVSYGKSYGSKAGDKEHQSDRGKAIGHGGNEVKSTAGGVQNEVLSGQSQSDAQNAETAGHDSGDGHGAGKAKNRSRNSDHGNAYGHQTDAEKKLAHNVTDEGLSSLSQGSSDDSGPIGIVKADKQAYKSNPGKAYGHNKDVESKPAGLEKKDALSGSTQRDLHKAETSGRYQDVSVTTEQASTTQQITLQTNANTDQTSAITDQTTSSYSQQWVRIPFPLSSFYPPSPVSGSTTSGGTAASAETGSNNSPSGSSNKSAKPNANNSDLLAAQQQYAAISGWFGSQAREDTVDSVNEAGDAIWKNTRPSPRDGFNSEDL